MISSINSRNEIFLCSIGINLSFRVHFPASCFLTWIILNPPALTLEPHCEASAFTAPLPVDVDVNGDNVQAKARHGKTSGMFKQPNQTLESPCNVPCTPVILPEKIPQMLHGKKSKGVFFCSWWIQIFCFCLPLARSWGYDPLWTIFFNWIESTNEFSIPFWFPRSSHQFPLSNIEWTYGSKAIDKTPNSWCPFRWCFVKRPLSIRDRLSTQWTWYTLVS